MVARLRRRPEWQFFSVLPRADPVLAGIWWLLLLLRGALPAVFAIAMGWLVGAVQHGSALAVPMTLMGTAFVLLQVLTPVHQAVSANLGSRVAAWLNDALAKACVGPPGIGHLEDPDLTEDLTVAREFDRGQTAPPMYMNVDFIAGSVVELASCGTCRSCWCSTAALDLGRARRTVNSTCAGPTERAVQPEADPRNG